MTDRQKFLGLIVLIAALWFGGRDLPPPVPPVPPAPVVVDGVAWVVVVEQTEERSVEVAKLIASDWPTKIKAKFRPLDYDAASEAFRKLADEAGMPAMVLLDEGGRVLLCEPFDAAKLKEIVQ